MDDVPSALEAAGEQVVGGALQRPHGSGLLHRPPRLTGRPAAHSTSMGPLGTARWGAQASGFGVGILFKNEFGKVREAKRNSGYTLATLDTTVCMTSRSLNNIRFKKFWQLRLLRNLKS